MSLPVAVNNCIPDRCKRFRHTLKPLEAEGALNHVVAYFRRIGQQTLQHILQRLTTLCSDEVIQELLIDDLAEANRSDQCYRGNPFRLMRSDCCSYSAAK
ncbi:hypothetical protein D3C71_1547130 [compost metagenome]